MAKLVEMRICLGSSCYVRGNDKVLSIAREFLFEQGLEQEVDFRGHLCKGNCAQGPNFSIDACEYHQLTEDQITDILQTHFTASHSSV